jgi:polysaccharide pyruvyl transferase WcaK-like protein
MATVKLLGLNNSNLGDDLLYLSAFQILSKVNSVVSTYSGHDRINKLIEKAFNTKVIVDRNSNLQVNVGGTILSSKYSLKTKIGHLLGIKTIPFQSDSDIYISLGVDEKYFLLREAKKLAANADAVFVRDIESHIALSIRAGFHKSYLLPDTTFVLKKILQTMKTKSPPSLRKEVNVHIVRNWSTNLNLQKKQYDWLELNYKPEDVVVQFCESDSIPSQKFTTITYDGTYEILAEIILILKRCKKVYTARYHGLVLAIMCEKEFECFHIDEKISRLADYFASNSDEHEVYFNLHDDAIIEKSYVELLNKIVKDVTKTTVS